MLLELTPYFIVRRKKEKRRHNSLAPNERPAGRHGRHLQSALITQSHRADTAAYASGFAFLKLDVNFLTDSFRQKTK